MRIALILGAGLAVLGLVVFAAPNTGAYPIYHGDGNCFTCHPGFAGPGPLHAVHVGGSQMTGTCQLCHTSFGDDPRTDSSGEDPNHSCNGCHLGPGLRAHHTNAGAPPDPDGLTCMNCHTDPPPPGEEELPAYYLRADVNVKEPCDGLTSGPGEDYDGDGLGLDNDGDLLYDTNDPDCGAVQAEILTWGRAKAIYR